MLIQKIRWWLSDILWFRILGGSSIRKQYFDRCKSVVDTVLPMFTSDEPYVVSGKWSWYRSQGVLYPITMLFTEKPLAIQVFGPEVGSWDSCKLFCKNKSVWEQENQAASELLIICDKIGLPLLRIFWNDPIDAVSIKSRITELIIMESE